MIDKVSVMTLRKSLVWAGVAVLLSACASTPPAGAPARERILQELERAQQERPKPATPEAVSQALLPPLVVEMPKTADVSTEPKFDLVVNDAPAAQVFMAMVSGTRYSVLVHPNVKETISVNLKDVTVLEALDALRELYGYEYTFQGPRIFIQPITLQTRVFQVNYLQGQRRGRSDLRVSSGSISDSSASAGTAGTPGTVPTGTTPPAGGTTRSLESSRISTSSDSDFWADLQTSLRAIVGSAEGRNVVTNPQAGIIVVRALPAELRQVADFLKKMQLVVERQVMLEAKIIEVELNDSFQAGINWAAFKTGNNSRFAAGQLGPGTTLRTDGSLSTSTARAPDGSLLAGSTLTADPASAVSAMTTGAAVAGSVFGLAFQTSSFAALLNFLETQGTVHVLSSPRIATLNNQKAVLKVGADEFFVTNVSTTTTSTGTTATVSPTITVQPFFSGIALDVTPQIDEKNNIILHIHPSVSQVVDRTKNMDLGSLGNFRLPLASSTINETDSIVRVQDSRIVAIGGLMRQQSLNDRSQLPGAGDLPGLGVLFRSTGRSNVKSELVILLKPTIIQGEESWQQDLQETTERIRSLARP